MADPAEFKRGGDLRKETRSTSAETVTCMDCGKEEEDEEAYRDGWQMEPAICSTCLHWTLTDAGKACCSSP